jgi:hypothetical protein
VLVWQHLVLHVRVMMMMKLSLNQWSFELQSLKHVQPVTVLTNSWAVASYWQPFCKQHTAH